MTVYHLLDINYHLSILKVEDTDTATNKKVFTLRLSDEVFDKIGTLATREHRSMTNYIEYILMQHLEQTEKECGEIQIDQTE